MFYINRIKRQELASRMRSVPMALVAAGIAFVGVHVAGAKVTLPEWEVTLRAELNEMADRLTATLKPWEVPDRVYSVETFGAVADGETINTVAIQKAIDACSAAGGGVVLFSKGDYVTGTIVLKSGVMLDVAQDSRILGSTNLEDYPDHVAQRKTVMDTNMEMHKSLIFAEGVERVGIRGLGTIDFRGSQKNFPGKQTISQTPGRPFGIRMLDSSRIVVEDITLMNAACWLQNYLNCEDLIFQRMKVINQANHNNDGIDIDGCRRVIVRDCFINAEDDAFCLKGCSLRPTEDLLVENSEFYSTCNAFKIGTDTQGDFRRIFARNLKLGGIRKGMVNHKNTPQASTGITLATVDGGVVEDILIQNVVIEQTRCPIYLRIGERSRLLPGMPRVPAGPLRRIVIEDVTGNNNYRQGSFISGLGKPQAFIEDVVIRRVNLGMQGGGTADMVMAEVNDCQWAYPDAHQFSPKGLPSHGFYIRTARRIHFEDIVVTPDSADERPLFAMAENAEEVTLDGAVLEAQIPSVKK
jgi:polygalacturonase